jgi:hypothetical protein
MEIKGKVTIDLKTFEELVNKAKTLEALEKHKMSVEDTALEMIKRDREEMQVEILGIISDIDESDARPIFEEIDGTVMTDKEVDMKYQEAISKFKIVISPQKLKRLIQKNICASYPELDSPHVDIRDADEETLNKMEVVIAGKEK